MDDDRVLAAATDRDSDEVVRDAGSLEIAAEYFTALGRAMKAGDEEAGRKFGEEPMVPREMIARLPYHFGDVENLLRRALPPDEAQAVLDIYRDAKDAYSKRR